MILLNNVIDELVNTCFSPDEISVLEVSVNNRVVSTVQRQLLFYYKDYCYPGTKEDLFADFAYTKDLNIHLLHKIKDIKLNIEKLLNLQGYNEVLYLNSNYDNSSGGVSSSRSDSEKKSSQYDISTSDSETLSSATTINQSGTSESNELDILDTVMKSVNVELPKKKKFKLNIDTTNSSFTTTELDSPDTKLSVNINAPKVNREYQNLTQDQTNNIDKAQTYDINSAVSEDKTSSIDKSSSVSANSTIGKRAQTSVKVNENEARIKSWQVNLPKVKEEFFHCFQDLFCHERRY